MVAVGRTAWRGAWMTKGALDQKGELCSADIGQCCRLDLRAWTMGFTRSETGMSTALESW